MANADTPFGLRLLKHKHGAPYNAAVNAYYIPASDAKAAFIGDPVVKTGTANTAEVTFPGVGTWDIATLPVVTTADASVIGDALPLTGVIVDIAAMPDSLSNVHKPASTEAIVFVCDDPDAEFEIQADGAIPATSIGLNAVLIRTHEGSATTALSGVELDTTSDVPAADASNQLTILRQVNRVDNEVNLLHNKVVVKINNHTEAHGVIGI